MARHAYEVSILFTAKNRLDFTRQALTSVLENTNWRMVESLVIYDDGSTDGTREWLTEHAEKATDRADIRYTSFGNPVAITADFVPCCVAPYVAKIDNDTLVPPGWLDIGLRLLDDYREFDCIGLEWMGLTGKEPHVAQETDSTGGLFLARRSAFDHNGLPRAEGQYSGWQPYQWRTEMKCAWIKPSIPVVLMDRIPAEPYASHNREYRAQGWQRPWKDYRPDQKNLWNWWRWRA